MYIEAVPNRNSPPAYLLRESYREDGKVKKRTIANLSALDVEEIDALKQVLKGRRFTAQDTSFEDSFEVLDSTPHGHVAAVLGTMKNLNIPYLISKVDSPERRNAIALIAGRILHPSSKLSLSRYLIGKFSTLSDEIGLCDDLTEGDLYASMRWLFDRQERIQKSLSKRHLEADTVVLYDLSSSYYEGDHCELAKFGHNRDKKKGKKQINYGLLTDKDGRPIAVEVFPGNTSDTSTVSSQLARLKENFQLKKAIIVGDRGMLTSTQLELASQDPNLKDFGWVSALTSRQIQTLVNDEELQPELFDQRNLAEITSDHYPGERLIACHNLSLAKKRNHDRQALLEKTEQKLQSIIEATKRTTRPYHGKDKIARRVEKEASKYKVLKHFILEITETSLTYKRDEESISKEAQLDGIYIIRGKNIDSEELDSTEIVKTYKKLTKVERAFRNLKTTALKIRPIFHRDSDMVKAHIFVCMLAYYVQWEMEFKLSKVLFREEDSMGREINRKDVVNSQERSEEAKMKDQTKLTEDGYPVQSFSTLLEELGKVSKITCKSKLEGATSFNKQTKLTEFQEKL